MNLWQTALAGYRWRHHRASGDKNDVRLVRVLDEGYHSSFDDRLNDRCESAYQSIGHPSPAYHTGRTGMHTHAAMREVAPHFWTVQWRMAMAVGDEMVDEQVEILEKTLERYHELVVKFRGAVKNDVASVKAQAVATEDTVNRIGRAYAQTAHMLTTPEFERALANAERMAAALKAVAELKTHSITFAVLDAKREGA